MDPLPSIIAIQDNICIYSCTPEEHAWHLLQLMKAANQHSIIFNSSKFQFRQPEIAFYGAVFTIKGMWPDPSKIQAFQDLPNLNSPVKLQSFLGLINYLQPFIPGLSNKTMFLWEQLTKWDWNPSMDAAFHCLQAWICQTPLNTTLTYYDYSKPVIWQTDTSKYGLSAALIQSSQPVAFISKTLTEVKTCYVNIEWECLSVFFNLEK